ncbi:MAG: hypothetical protein COU35_04985 [Candidatus Magasanikbacteria bacterium CG10_big_fil_rev_8_21_14_0_10_47_10]|uniref:Septum formation initiator n=1 Tax=Candidatus Magasanikbacteria bacterium CG10_big_fil_rev_8_21_14_0_10_47_10 TaxID=1974652 RepID=A0A2H0TP92_9BACT|nr:MAG: hypothetical protein COU35_04985 [Candidatus Magasanikbacteria bacterium CG10_big_fil_rev_8_21_14_0_10_47_10]
MSRQKQHGVFRRFFGSRLFLIIALIVLTLIALSFARAYYQDYKIRQQIAELREEVHQLEKRKLESMEILDYVTSDTFVEEKARTELNMKKSGENVVVISDPGLQEFSGRDIMQEPPDSQASADTPNPLKWWYYFTHN